MLQPTHQASQGSQSSYASEVSVDDDSDVEFAEDEDVPMAAAEPSEVVMSSVDLAAEQTAQISQIVSLLEVPPVTASVLLRKFQWSTERLLEQYYEDPERVLQKAGIVGIKRQKTDEGAPAAAEITCGVCFCDVSPDECTANERCGHRFCNDCWAGHLGVQIKEGNANAIVCMEDKCQALVEIAMVQALVDAPTFARFARFAQKQFVEDNPYLKFCPAVDCDKVIKVQDLGCSEVRCSCRMLFCFGCSREAHFPLTCEQLNRWEDKNASDGATGQWMQVNTKRCRKCNARVEKNGGCNWIHCRCGHQFCYFCFSTDPGHHGQPCNAPPSAEEKSAQSELDYYMHYFERWNGHRQSQELEVKLREGAVAQMEALVADERAAHLMVEVQHVSDATETLIECRRILKSTYPFAFFLKKGNEKDIFENLQGRLEGQTELLSAALEDKEGMKAERFAEHRVKLVELTADAKMRLKHMREGIEDGLLPPGPGAGPSGSQQPGSKGNPITL